MNYLYIVLIVCLFVIATLIIYYIINNNKREENDVEIKDNNSNDLLNNDTTYFPFIQIIENNIVVPHEKYLINNDNIKKIIATIDNTAVKGTMITNSSKTISELAKNGKVLFSASVEDASKMIKNSEGKYLGTQVSKVENILTGKRKNSFTGQTKFTKESGLVNNVKKQELTNITMNAASMVVGQYYMSEINDKLEEMKESIDNIAIFQTSEYKGRILSIVSKIDEITKNEYDILSNNETRKNSYHDVKDIEAECTKLLGQANTIIMDNIKEKNLNTKQYFEKVEKNEEWFKWQQITQSLLLKIDDLRYTLANGSEKNSFSHHQFNNYIDLTSKVNEQLELWHNNYIKKIGIDINKNRKKGNLFTIRKNTIGLINKDWNYDKIDKEIAKKISTQIDPMKFKKITNDKKDDMIVIQKYKDNYYMIQNN